MRNALSVLCALGLAACAARPGGPARSASPTADGSFDLVIAATTDVHGRVRGWDYYDNAPDPIRGLARAATIVDSVRRADSGRVVLVDAGDLLQGNPFTYVAARVARDLPHPVIAAMNVMRYDAAAIGNHEFNYGVPVLDRAIAQARFPFLAANVYRASTERRAYPAYRIVRRGGVRVGIIGATTPGSMIWDRENLAGRLVVRDVVPEVRQAVSEVREAGADIVVVVVHAGLDEPASYDTVATGLPSENVSARLAHDVRGIDLIVYGHSHREMADTTIGTTLLMQPKNWATSVGIAHLELQRDGERWRVTSHRGQLIPARGHAESPAVVREVRGAHERTVEYVTSVIGATPVAWRTDSARVMDTPLVDFILEVERKATGAELASTAAFSLDASLDAGPITVAEVAKLYPYENTLKVVRITGRQLRQYLEYSARYFGRYGTGESAVNRRVPGYNFDIIAGADYRLDLSRPAGSRVSRLTVKGRAVADTDHFTLALNNYRQSGGGGYAMLRDAPVVYDGQAEIRQLLIDEVKRRGSITPNDYFTRNWAIEPSAAIAPAYAAMQADAGERATRRNAAAGATRLRIIATNDFHGALEPRPDGKGVMRGGAAAMAAEIERAKRSCPAPCVTLLLDGGDEFQGTPASNLAYGKPVVRVFNQLGYAAAALGNHEFDWGVDTLRSRMRDARYAFLGANVRYADGRDVEWIPNDTIVTRGPYRIGIIGVATVETPKTTRARNVEGLRFDAPAPIVDSIARVLRARGANRIVVVAHMGAFCRGGGTRDCDGRVVTMANRLTEPVDAIVSGHTHSLIDATINGIPIVQALSSGRAVGIIDLGPTSGGRPSMLASEDVVNVVADSTNPPTAIDSIVYGATERVAARMSEPVARIAVAMPRSGNQYALGNLVADAQRWAAKADVAVMNNGGIRADLRSGTATYGSLFEIQPFGNTLYRMTVHGADLRAYVERLVRGHGLPRVHVSGITVAYDTVNAPGSRVVALRLANGQPVRDRGTYTIVMNDFMATGGDGLGLGDAAITVEPLNIVDLDALVDYLHTLPQPVKPPTGARFTVVKP